MTAESQPWWFDSHNNSNRTLWLQSTLSELEEKTKGMLKLIEGDADTFAQRAEMYYKKRPELVSMIEDFYRAYRSLAERHDILKMETGSCRGSAFDSTVVNRSWSQKEWNLMSKSCEISLGFSDSEESEVDDPEPEEDTVECNLGDVLDKRSDGCMVKLMAAEGPKIRDMTYRSSEFSSDFFDSDVSETEDSEPEVAKMESEMREVPEKRSSSSLRGVINEKEVTQVKHTKDRDGDMVNMMNGDERNKHKAIYIVDESVDSSLGFLDHPKFEGHGPEIKEAEGESKLGEGELPDNKCQSESSRLLSEVKRLKEENLAFKAELARKDEEKREVIRQLSMSVDILKEENDSMRKFIKDSKKPGRLFEFKKLKEVFSVKLFGSSKCQTTIVAL